jgi:hypothetical protein
MNLLLLIALALVPSHARNGTGAQPPAPVQDHQKIYDDFVGRFKQFMKVSATEDMVQMVRKEPAVAVRYADTLCQKVVTAGSEELEKEVAALRVAWKTAMKTNFVENLYEYHSLFDPHKRADRVRLVQEYDNARGRHLELLKGDRESQAFLANIAEFENLAKAFGELGDLLNVGRCWVTVAACWDVDYRGKNANFYKACAAQQKALAAYEGIGLAGPDVDMLKVRYDALVAGGFDAPEPPPEAAGPAPGQPAAAPDAAVINVQMAFAAVPEIETYQRPNYFADEIYQLWSALALLAKGSKATFQSQPQGSPSIERTGAAQFAVHDGSNPPREPIGVTGKLTLVEANVSDAGTSRPWAFVAKIGLQEDFYQTRKSNLGPSDTYMPLFYFNAASMVGMLEGIQLRVLDDNLDGIYGSAPLTWQYVGLAPGSAQPDMDCIVVGESQRALPWSEFLEVGPRWYRLTPHGGGTVLQAVPVELETGTLRLDFKGEAPQWLVLRGTGVLANTFIDLCSNAKGVKAPVGEYKLYAGLIRKGKKQQTMKCLILGNDTVAPFTVTAGAETVVNLGGPWRFDFGVQKAADKVTVVGSSLVVIGQAGETYDRFWNCIPIPEASVRKAGTKRGGKPEEMPYVKGDLDELTEEGKRKWSFADVWRPLSLEIPLKKEGEAVEVQLTEKKHKLLGSIESAWK